MNSMRDSLWLSGLGLAHAVVNFFSGATDVEWLTVFMILCAGFIVKALEDLKESR